MDGSQLRARTGSSATARPIGGRLDGGHSAAVRAAGPRSATTRPAGKRRRRSPGWVPNQHGAWAMVIVPALAGVLLSGPSWRHVPLLGLWWVGYFEIGRASCRERVGGLEVAASRTQQDRKIRTL